MNHHRKQRTSSAALLVERSKFGDILEDANNPILLEAFSYMQVVAIVDKKMVCADWEKKGQKTINDKRHPVKRTFTENRELRDEVVRYCKGDHDDIEEIAEEFGYPIGMWDVSRVEDFSRVFYSASTFNECINNWNVANGKNMERMFARAELFNQSLSCWNVSKAENMSDMFCCAYEFNGDVSTWDTSTVTSMSRMFCYAWKFNGDVSSWETSAVIDMSRMFYGAWAFNGNLSRWNISLDANTMRMFDGATNFDRSQLDLWVG